MIVNLSSFERSVSNPFFFLRKEADEILQVEIQKSNVFFDDSLIFETNNVIEMSNYRELDQVVFWTCQK